MRTVLAHFKYKYEADEAPADGVLYLSDREYFDDVYNNPYVEAIRSTPTYSRGLSGDRLGSFRSTYGTMIIDNASGEFDGLLGLACDGSEVEFYYGDDRWPFDDFSLVTVPTVLKIESNEFDQLIVSLKDTGIFLNKSIGGTVEIGGTGPNTGQFRPFNFGYVRQVSCRVIDPFALLYAYNDQGNGGVNFVCDVQDRGVSVPFVDNYDGTFTLLSDPDGDITAHIMAPCSDSVLTDDSMRRRVSHAFLEVAGIRSGLSALGKYGGAGPTFVDEDDRDYFVGFSVTEATNVIELLDRITDTGNCFWAIDRLGQFTYGRLRPGDISSLGLEPRKIEEDDIDHKAGFKIDHITPGYYKFQAYMDKNWSIPSSLADSLELDPEQRDRITRPGLYKIQEDAVGVTYADAPELYDLTMAISPAVETILSGGEDSGLLVIGGDDEIDLPILIQWLEDRRFLTLPWLEILTLQVKIEFFDLEMGAVVLLTMPRFGLDLGELFQVIGIDIMLTSATVKIQLLRRRLSTPYPDGWVRITTSPDEDPVSAPDLDYEFAVTTDPPPPTTPPPGIGEPPISSGPWWPGNLSGLGFLDFEPSAPFFFDWAVFVNGLDDIDIENVLTNTSNDNVQLVTRLGGPAANWKALALSDPGVNFAVSYGGTFGGGNPDWAPLNSLKLTHWGPDFGDGDTSLMALSGTTFYDAYLAFVDDPALPDTDPTAFSSVGDVHTMTLPGVAVWGSDGGWGNINGYSTTDEMMAEQYFEENPGAFNTTEGFPGVTWFYMNGGNNFESDGDSDIEEYREGLFDVDADPSDPAFDGSTMHVGVWVKKNGSNYDLMKVVNGVVTETIPISFLIGLEYVGFDIRFYDQDFFTTGSLAWAEVYTEAGTDDDGSSTSDFDQHQIDLNDVKYAQYTKPNVGNTVPFTTATYVELLTNPGYPLNGNRMLYKSIFDSGSDLASNTLYVGSTWRAVDGISDFNGGDISDYVIASDLAYDPTANYGMVTAGSPPGPADYASTVVVQFDSTEAEVAAGGSGAIANFNAVVGVRMDTAAGYVLQLGYDTGIGWRLILAKADSTALDTYDEGDGLVGTLDFPLELRLEVQGTSLKGYLGGILRVSATDATFSAAGEPGWLGWTAAVKISSAQAFLLP